VYDGPDSSVTVLNIHDDMKYYVSVFEYNKPDGYPNYLTTALTGNISTQPDYIALKYPGVPYRPELDSFASDVPPGWHIGTSALPSNDGTNTNAGVYSFIEGNDAYIGSIGSPVYGMKLVNKSTVPYTSILVRFDGTQWYSAAADAASADSLFVEYSTDAAHLGQLATWTRLDNATFTTMSFDTTSGGTGTVWGSAGASSLIQASIPDLDLQPGQHIWVRFRDYDKPGQNDALVLSDLQVVPFSNTYDVTDNIPPGVYNDLNVVHGTLSLDSTVTVKRAVNIETGARLNLNNSKLILRENLYGYGRFAGTALSSLFLNGVGRVYNIAFDQSANTLFHLSVRANSTVVLDAPLRLTASPRPGRLSIGRATAGTSDFYSNGNLILASDSFGTAYIASVYGAIHGDIIVERWLQTDSSIRVLSHPFNSSLVLDQLDDDATLDVSGTASQNLWYYDASLAAPSGIAALVSDTVWTPYGTTSALWPAYQAVRYLKGHGSAVLDIQGNPNQGAVSVSVQSTLSDSFVIVGNPYPASLRLGQALAEATGPGGNMSNAAIWTWNPTKGNAGGFTVVPSAKFPTAKIPICGSFVAMVTPGSSSVLNFNESDKAVTTVTKTWFKPSGEEVEEEVPVEEPEIILNQGLQLSAEQAGEVFDETYIYFDQQAHPAKEYADAPKLINPEFNFCSISSSMEKLSVDVRPFENGKIVDLQLTTSSRGDFTFVAGDYNLPEGTELYLVDKYLGIEKLLKSGTKYGFTLDDKPGSQGSRFHLRMGQSSLASGSAALTLTMMPNPATDQVTVLINAPQDGEGVIRLISVTGQEMRQVKVASVKDASVVVSLDGIASGMYLVEFTTNGNKVVRRLVKR
jgi:hypothetical protein